MNIQAGKTDIKLIFISIGITLLGVIMQIVISDYDKLILVSNVVIIASVLIYSLMHYTGLRNHFSVRNIALSFIVCLAFYRLLSMRFQQPVLLFLTLVLFTALVVDFDYLIKTSLSKFKTLIPKLTWRFTEGWVIIALYTLCSLLLLWIFRFPYMESPDTANQWNQIHGVFPYSDIHAIGHTIFLKAILSLWDSFTAVIIVQMIMIVFMFGLLSRYFCKKEVPLSLQLLFTALFNSAFAYTEPYFYPWKDTPYTFCIGIMVYYLIKITDTEKMAWYDFCLIGVVLAGTFIFRLNGIVVTLFILSWLIYRYRQRIIPVICIIMTMIIVTLSVNYYAYDVLKAEKHANGFSIQVFGTGLAAIINDDPTEAEYEEISKLIPADWAVQKYTPWFLNSLIWESDGMIDPESDLEVFNNQFVLMLGENRNEIIKLYFKLMPRHFFACMKNIIYSTHMIWGHKKNILVILDNVSLIAATVIMLRNKWNRDLIRSRWIVFMPVVLNIVSIAISTVTNEPRYLLPTTALFPFCFFYILSFDKQKMY